MTAQVRRTEKHIGGMRGTSPYGQGADERLSVDGEAEAEAEAEGSGPGHRGLPHRAPAINCGAHNWTWCWTVERRLSGAWPRSRRGSGPVRAARRHPAYGVGACRGSTPGPFRLIQGLTIAGRTGPETADIVAGEARRGEESIGCDPSGYESVPTDSGRTQVRDGDRNRRPGWPWAGPGVVCPVMVGVCGWLSV